MEVFIGRYNENIESDIFMTVFQQTADILEDKRERKLTYVLVMVLITVFPVS